MSLKGHNFVRGDLSKEFLRKAKPDQIESRLKELNGRYRIVAVDGETKIIAEELDQRALNKLSPKARRIAGAMMLTDQKTRAEVIAAFEADGALKHPFTMK